MPLFQDISLEMDLRRLNRKLRSCSPGQLQEQKISCEHGPDPPKVLCPPVAVHPEDWTQPPEDKVTTRGLLNSN